MKRFLFAALAVLLLATPASSQDRLHFEPVLAADGVVAAIPVASTGVATTQRVDLRQFGTNEALMLIATSVSGAADVKIEYQLSLDAATWTAVASYSDLVSVSNTTFSANPEGLNRILLPVLPGRFVRFVVTGVGSNPADTTVTLWFAGRGVMR